jgi:hypothetical protein
VVGETLQNENRSDDIRKELGVYSMNKKFEDCITDWLDHLYRMDEDHIPKMIFKYTT